MEKCCPLEVIGDLLSWKLSKKLKAKIKVEKIEENVFKFTVGSKEERDRIFNGRPWFLNGAHMVLKIWETEEALDEISFRESTFILQIHGLPPVFIHKGTTEKIGEKIEKVHANSINGKCIVANRFLRIRVDIDISKSIPAGFFQERWRRGPLDSVQI